MVCPKLSVSLLPTTRLRMSAEPPGANGTMILIGLSGYLSAAGCDCAPAANAATPAATPLTQRIRGARPAVENHIGALPKLLLSLTGMLAGSTCGRYAAAAGAWERRAPASQRS